MSALVSSPHVCVRLSSVMKRGNGCLPGYVMALLTWSDARDGGSRGESLSPRSEAPQAPDLLTAAGGDARDCRNRAPLSGQLTSGCATRQEEQRRRRAARQTPARAHRARPRSHSYSTPSGKMTAPVSPEYGAYPRIGHFTSGPAVAL